jgi:C4-dicarboxylate-specific signal transduction histidine kinase
MSMSNPLSQSKPPRILSFGLAVLSVAVALVTARLLDIYLVTAPASLFLCAIMFGTWAGGTRAGLFSVALSLLCFKYYFAAPVYSLAIQPDEIPRTIFFLLSALFVWSLSARQNRAAESLTFARDNLATINGKLQAENAERKRAEEALHKTQTELAHVARMTTLGELTASIAHEVNQPLAAIVTNGDVCMRWLDREVPDLAEVREALHDMISNGRRASEIIHRLRALSRSAEIQKVALDINDAISEVIPLLQHEVFSHRVSLRLELALTLPAVLGDRVQLQQVIINLIVNGMEAMAPVTDRSRELVVRSQLDASGEVLIAVEDSGIGIDPENAKRLFNAFFTTKPSGMGMGLSICRSIIENHGGRLWASRNAGHGATFQFALPSRPEQAV